MSDDLPVLGKDVPSTYTAPRRALRKGPRREFTTLDGSGLRAPAHLAHVLGNPAEMLLRLHGVVVGETTCPHCGLVAQEAEYPRGACRGCARPFSRRCGRSTCSALVDPSGCLLRKGGKPYWSDPAPYCAEHQTRARSARDERMARLRRPVAAGGIPTEILSAALSWRSYPWRDGAWGRLCAWAEGGFDRGDGPKAAYIRDKQVGAGKSVMAARLLMTYYAERESLADFVWVTPKAIAKAYQDKWQRVNDEPTTRACQAQKVLDLCGLGAEMLVIDDWGQWPKITPGFRDTLAEILRDRMENHRHPVIFTSNLMPNFDPVEDEASLAQGIRRIADRVFGSALLLETNAPSSLRAARRREAGW